MSVHRWCVTDHFDSPRSLNRWGTKYSQAWCIVKALFLCRGSSYCRSLFFTLSFQPWDFSSCSQWKDNARNSLVARQVVFTKTNILSVVKQMLFFCRLSPNGSKKSTNTALIWTDQPEVSRFCDVIAEVVNHFNEMTCGAGMDCIWTSLNFLKILEICYQENLLAGEELAVGRMESSVVV